MSTVGKVQDKGKAKEEDLYQDQRIDDMTKVIKNLSNKLVKLEIDNNKPAKQNRGVFNPQLKKQPLQILQRERKDQDQVQAPLYIEAAPSHSVDDDEKEDDDQISVMYME